jgi:CoA:oxalate CoA-transferase|tara:strand:- start:5429 stop:6586 length:1158 start_codon:yes stop_codon:yes gene_type:complete
MKHDNKEGALFGIKVIDLTRVLSGPFCTMLLADMGAEVIKVEPPKGDNVRNQGDMIEGFSSYFAQFNRNKKSIVLDLYKVSEKEILKSLLLDADIVVDNFKAGVFAKMGFDDETLKLINPRLIRASVNGFGSKGVMSDRPAFDFIAQALSGFMSVNGTEETGPMRAAMPISDLVAGLYCAFGIVCALQARSRNNEGQRVEASLTSSLVSMMAYLSSESFVKGKAPNKSGNNHPILAPYGLFKSSDGEVAVAPASDKFCNVFLKCIELSDLLDQDLYKNNENRMKNRDSLNNIINGKMSKKTSDFWIKKLNDAGCPAAKVASLPDALNSQLIKDSEMIISSSGPEGRKIKMTGFPVKLSETPARLYLSPPLLGEHTEEILKTINKE